MRKNNLSYRVSQLEKNYEKLDTKIDILLTNEVPHLEQKMASLRTRMDVLTGFNIGAIIIAILAARFL